jgi:3-methyladenine DNA glycosylase AlkD
MKRLPPGLTLFLLAPVLAELLSGHQPPPEFVNPLSWAITSLPYGCAAVICRELVARWGKGWPPFPLTLLVLLILDGATL